MLEGFALFLIIFEIYNIFEKKHPDSEKLYCEKIDLGYEVREIASGVQKQIPLEKMAGLVMIAANLKPKKLGGFPSNGMVMMASNSEHTIIELLRPEECKIRSIFKFFNF